MTEPGVAGAGPINANIARHLAEMAQARPTFPALKVPQGRTAAGDIDYLALSFAELDGEVAAWCERLHKAGVRRGTRTLVMVRQGLPLIASVFALFRLGAVPVVIDPGMGLRSFLRCVERSKPLALVGIPVGLLLSRFFRRAFSSVHVRVATSSRLTARLAVRGSRQPTEARSDLSQNAPTDLAAVLFTSGSTGAPKGVCYEHGMFDAQVRSIRETYGIEPGEIDLPLLPIFALFNPALGMTTIVPEIDPRRPAAFDPARIVRAIQQEKVTNSFGSPTLWTKIGEHCLARNITLPSLRRILCAGAPVPANLWRASKAFLPNGRLHSPYGATEALPVTSIASDEVTHAVGRGACVGRSVGAIEVAIIAITEGPIASWADVRERAAGEVGEIVVRGPVVTKQYDADAAATRAAKIPMEPSNVDSPADVSARPLGAAWHRMGDCGYRDAEGRLWFCGRKAERVESANGTLHTEPCEQVFRTHPRVGRCALIGHGEHGRQVPALVVEGRVTPTQAQALAAELRALGREHDVTRSIRRFYFREKLPVDVRHNAKIHRLTLAQWAQTATAYEVT